MNSGDAGVPDAIDGVAHRFGSQRRFFSDGNIARAGCDDCDRADTVIRLVATDAYESRGFVPFGVCNDVANLAIGAFVSACDENVWRALYESIDDADYLRARLAAAKNDFRKALARRTGVIDAREADVFEVKILIRSSARLFLSIRHSCRPPAVVPVRSDP